MVDAEYYSAKRNAEANQVSADRNAYVLLVLCQTCTHTHTLSLSLSLSLSLPLHTFLIGADSLDARVFGTHEIPGEALAFPPPSLLGVCPSAPGSLSSIRPCFGGAAALTPPAPLLHAPASRQCRPLPTTPSCTLDPTSPPCSLGTTPAKPALPLVLVLVLLLLLLVVVVPRPLLREHREGAGTRRRRKRAGCSRCGHHSAAAHSVLSPSTTYMRTHAHIRVFLVFLCWFFS